MDLTTRDIKPNATFFTVQDPNLEWPKHRGSDYWEYRRKWSEYPQKMHTSNFPIHLDIETTNVCNLLCPHCPRTIQINEGRYVDIGTMSLEMYKKIIDEGEKEGLCSVKLNYLGEPLLDKYILERIKYSKDHGVIEVMINTNAMTLDEKMSHKILEAGIDSVYFSVDSINADNFNKIRVGADYKVVVDNIKKFIKIKNEGKYKHVQTRTSMVVMPQNKNEVDAYVKFWKPIVGIVGLGEWIEYTSSHGKYEQYNPDFVCAQPFQRMFILWDGVCTPCCVDDGRGYILGDIKKNTVKEIWHGEAFTKMREAHIGGHYNDISICARCYLPYAQENATDVGFSGQVQKSKLSELIQK